MNPNLNIMLKNFFESTTTKIVVALIGIIGTVVTIFGFLQNNEVLVAYEITANANVLDFNAEVSKLEVFFDSTNLKQTKKNLRIYTIKIINNGGKDLIKEFYDDNDPLGIRIKGGEIIENPEIIQSSNDYISRNLKIIQSVKNEFKFSQIILESKEFFTVKFLVLHNLDSIPVISPMGKIAGQRDIRINNSIDLKGENSFFARAFNGNIWIQLVRLFSYFFITLAVIIFIVFTISKIDDTVKEHHRENIINQFKQLKSYKYTKTDNVIFDYYQKNNLSYLQEIDTIIDDENELNNIYKSILKGLKNQEVFKSRKSDKINIEQNYDQETKDLIESAIKDGFIIKDIEKLIVNKQMKRTLARFLEFIESNDKFKKGITENIGVKIVEEEK